MDTTVKEDNIKRDDEDKQKITLYIPKLLNITSKNMETINSCAVLKPSVGGKDNTDKPPSMATTSSISSLGQTKVEITGSIQVVDNKDMDKMCRICYGGETKSEKLLTPCLCSGSTKYAHEECLVKWFSVKQSKTCELCLYQIQVTCRGMKPFWKWRRPKYFCDIVMSLTILYSLIMFMFLAMVIWIASSGHCYSALCISLYFLCLIAIGYFCYCCIYMDCMKESCRVFLEVNRRWSVVGRQATLVNDEITRSEV